MRPRLRSGELRRGKPLWNPRIPAGSATLNSTGRAEDCAQKNKVRHIFAAFASFFPRMRQISILYSRNPT
jgi:hypothetical protein